MKNTFILLILLFFIGCEESPVIETINGEKITVKKFEDFYGTAIESMSRMQNIEKKNLIEFIAKDINEVPDQFKSLNYQFKKKNFYENYKQMLITKSVAEKSGFAKRPDIQAILKQVEMQTITTLYIQEQVEKKIQISDEEAMAECEKLRKENGGLTNLTLDKCMMVGRGSLKEQRSKEILPRVLERIKEGVTIKHNEKFELDSYLNKDFNAAEISKDAKAVAAPATKETTPTQSEKK